MTSKQEICPKCGYQPFSTDECPQCGISVSKFEKLWQRKEREPGEPIKIAEKTGCKDDFFWLLKWTFRVLLILCQTPIDAVRQEHGKPPGKNHVALLENRSTTWLTPDEYAALDRSKYINLDTLIKKYNQAKRELEF